MNNQLTPVTNGFYLVGAVAGNVGGSLVLTGFLQGRPVFTVQPRSNVVSTTAASNVLTPQSATTRYQNEGSNSTTTFILPTPSSSQQLSIANSGSSDALLVQAPAGTKIRFNDELYSAIQSAGNSADNMTLVGESSTIWRVTYAGETSQGSLWVPQT